MNQDLFLFAQLVIFLVGALLYGFLSRELLRRPSILPGLPMRLAVICLTIWYAGCLLDVVAYILLPPGYAPNRLATALDLIRGFAWLTSFPLLTHTFWLLLPQAQKEPGAGQGGEGDGEVPHRPRQPAWYWLLPGYLSLLLFVPAAWRMWQEGSFLLGEVGREVYVFVVFHAVLTTAVATWMLLRAIRVTREPRLAQFLRWLLPALGTMVVLVSAGTLLNLAGVDQGWAEPAWRIGAEASGLVLGLTFLYFVQRYNLLRLSLSYRSLRHFLAILALVLLVMVSGPAVGIEGTEVFRRFVAWGLIAALAAGSFYTPLRRAATRRSRWLSQLLGETITAEEIHRLSQRIQSLELREEELKEVAVDEIGKWLSTRPRFLSPQELGGRPEALRLYFEDPKTRAFNRLDAPSAALAEALGDTDLHAVFPLRVAGNLAGVLGLEVSSTGGGYQDGEMEAVALVVGQLAAAIELRRAVEARLANERRLAERERLSLLGLVAASLAHEIKNPLSSMKALAQTVSEELRTSSPHSDQAQDLAIIVEQIDRLNAVAREILDFAGAPGGDPEQGVELTALLRSTLYVLGYLTRRRGIELDQSGVCEVGRVRGTSATWQTVLLNLMVNAVHHAPTGSTVKARLCRDGEHVVFGTENAGPPIAPEIARHLFEPFVSGGGTGLGLGLVAQRVDELGGRIEVENEPDRIRFQVRV